MHQHLVHVRRVGQDSARGTGEALSYVDSRRQGGPQELECFLNNRLELEQLGGLFRVTTEGQNLRHEFFGPFPRSEDLPQTVLHRCPRRGIEQSQFGEAHDSAENIVEAVRHTPGECANSLHFLGLAQGGFCMLAYGDFCLQLSMHPQKIGRPFCNASFESRIYRLNTPLIASSDVPRRTRATNHTAEEKRYRSLEDDVPELLHPCLQQHQVGMYRTFEAHLQTACHFTRRHPMGDIRFENPCHTSRLLGICLALEFYERLLNFAQQ